MSGAEQEHRDDLDSSEDVNYDDLLEELDNVLNPESSSEEQKVPEPSKEPPADIDEPLDNDFQFVSTADELQRPVSRDHVPAKKKTTSIPPTPTPAPPEEEISVEPEPVVVEAAPHPSQREPLDQVVEQEIHLEEPPIAVRKRTGFDFRRLFTPLIGLAITAAVVIIVWYLLTSNLLDVRTDYQQAQQFHKNGEYGKAAELYFSHATNLKNPEQNWQQLLNEAEEVSIPQALYLAGSCWELAGDVPAATNAYMQVVTCYPKEHWSAESLYSLGNISFNAGRTIQAEACLTQLIRKYSTHFLVLSGQAHFALANGYQMAGQRQESMDTYEEVLHSPLMEQVERAKIAIAINHWSTGEREAALALLKEVSENEFIALELREDAEDKMANLLAVAEAEGEEQ